MQIIFPVNSCGLGGYSKLLRYNYTSLLGKFRTLRLESEI
jgi:hypothetical protein